MKIQMISSKLLTLMLAFLAPGLIQAVSPPPDGGYANYNTAEGTNALFSLTTGTGNTAVGFQALYNVTNASRNTATGFNAMVNNTTGTYNTADGAYALVSNSMCNYNTASGDSALEDNTSGSYNTATAYGALLNNTTGSSNIATGFLTLALNTTGNSNTAIGSDALSSNITGSNNIAIGAAAGGNLSTGSNNIDIGNAGVVDESNKIRIGTVGLHKNAFIAGIHGVTAADGIPVLVNYSGKLGTATSSARFKDAIKPMGKTSEAILDLQPVTFHYKEEVDPKGTPQFGLVAEQVEKVSPDLVARDEVGKPYTVRYEAVNAMLLNEFLKEHRKGQEQDAIIGQLRSAVAQQQKEIAGLIASLKEQAAQIQKVSNQLDANIAAPRLVVDNP